MTSSWKIAISVACIAVIAGVLIFSWVRREKAIEWKKSSEAASETRARAEQGDPKAQADLGRIYSHGQGAPQNYFEALRWYRRAADQGDPQGQDGLASMYYYGRGVPQDYAEALSWYRKSADQGYAKAENGIALMYSQGKGVPQDYAEALRCTTKALTRVTHQLNTTSAICITTAEECHGTVQRPSVGTKKQLIRVTNLPSAS